PSFEQSRAQRPCAAKEKLVELVARDLKRVIRAGVEGLGERVAHRSGRRRARSLDEPCPALDHEAAADLVEHADGIEHRHAFGKQRLAEMEARMSIALEHRDAPSEGRETGGADGTGRTASDDRDVDVHSAVFGGGPSWMRSPMYAPMSVSRMPMPAKMR